MIINSNNPDIHYVTKTDTILSYLRTISKYPVLTAKEESELLKKYRETNDQSARDRLINCNQRFIFSAAKRFSPNPEIVMDLVSEGNIGFIKALERYDSEKGMRLLTFAQAYIRKYMMYYVTYNKPIKRWIDEKYGPKIAEERSLFQNEHGRYPTNSELKDIIFNKYGKDDFDESMLVDFEYSSIDEPSLSGRDDDGGSDSEFRKFTASENGFVKKADREDLKAIILTALNNVCSSNREKSIVKMIYGIDTDREYSVSEVALKYGISETRVNQIRFSVEKRLRENKQFVYLVGA